MLLLLSLRYYQWVVLSHRKWSLPGGGRRGHGRLKGTQFFKGKSPPAKEKTHSWVHSLDCEFTHCFLDQFSPPSTCLIPQLFSTCPENVWSWLNSTVEISLRPKHTYHCAFNLLVQCSGQLQRIKILLESLLRNRLLFGGRISQVFWLDGTLWWLLRNEQKSWKQFRDSYVYCESIGITGLINITET